LSSQRSEIYRLQTNLDQRTAVTPSSLSNSGLNTDGRIVGASASTEDELQRLKNSVASLKTELSRLDQMQAANASLRAQLASRAAAAFTPEELTGMEEARDRAMNIQCVNNLKQLGLAVRIWSMDHQQLSPPNVILLTNELGGSFKVLVCPADTGRQPATSAATLTASNCSYEYLAPQAPETEPQRILFRCPFHGNIGLIDGSVQMSVVKKHPNWIVQRDGKVYMEVPQAESQPQTDPAAVQNRPEQ
jgi:hypothetical protein